MIHRSLGSNVFLTCLLIVAAQDGIKITGRSRAKLEEDEIMDTGYLPPNANLEPEPVIVPGDPVWAEDEEGSVVNLMGFNRALKDNEARALHPERFTPAPTPGTPSPTVPPTLAKDDDLPEDWADKLGGGDGRRVPSAKYMRMMQTAGSDIIKNRQPPKPKVAPTRPPVVKESMKDWYGKKVSPEDKKPTLTTMQGDAVDMHKFRDKSAVMSALKDWYKSSSGDSLSNVSVPIQSDQDEAYHSSFKLGMDPRLYRYGQEKPANEDWKTYHLKAAAKGLHLGPTNVTKGHEGPKGAAPTGMYNDWYGKAPEEVDKERKHSFREEVMSRKHMPQLEKMTMHRYRIGLYESFYGTKDDPEPNPIPPTPPPTYPEDGIPRELRTDDERYFWLMMHQEPMTAEDYEMERKLKEEEEKQRQEDELQAQRDSARAEVERFHPTLPPSELPHRQAGGKVIKTAPVAKFKVNTTQQPIRETGTVEEFKKTGMADLFSVLSKYQTSEESRGKATLGPGKEGLLAARQQVTAAQNASRASTNGTTEAQKRNEERKKRLGAREQLLAARQQALDQLEQNKVVAAPVEGFKHDGPTKTLAQLGIKPRDFSEKTEAPTNYPTKFPTMPPTPQPTTLEPVSFTSHVHDWARRTSITLVDCPQGNMQVKGGTTCIEAWNKKQKSAIKPLRDPRDIKMSLNADEVNSLERGILSLPHNIWEVEAQCCDNDELKRGDSQGVQAQRVMLLGAEDPFSTQAGVVTFPAAHHLYPLVEPTLQAIASAYHFPFDDIFCKSMYFERFWPTKTSGEAFTLGSFPSTGITIRIPLAGPTGRLFLDSKGLSSTKVEFGHAYELMKGYKMQYPENGEVSIDLVLDLYFGKQALGYSDVGLLKGRSRRSWFLDAATNMAKLNLIDKLF